MEVVLGAENPKVLQLMIRMVQQDLVTKEMLELSDCALRESWEVT